MELGSSKVGLEYFTLLGLSIAHHLLQWIFRFSSDDTVHFGTTIVKSSKMVHLMDMITHATANEDLTLFSVRIKFCLDKVVAMWLMYRTFHY